MDAVATEATGAGATEATGAGASARVLRALVRKKKTRPGLESSGPRLRRRIGDLNP